MLCASPTVNSVTHVLSLVVLSQLLYLQQCARLPGRRPARRRRHVSIHPRPRHLRHRAVKVKVCLTCLRYNTKLTRAKRNRRRTHTNCIEGGVNWSCPVQTVNKTGIKKCPSPCNHLQDINLNFKICFGCPLFLFTGGVRSVTSFIKGTFYVAHNSVCWTDQSTLHFTPGRPVHSDSNLASLVSILAMQL